MHLTTIDELRDNGGARKGRVRVGGGVGSGLGKKVAHLVKVED